MVDIAVIAGTSGEALKLRPVIRAFDSAGITVELFDTGQQGQESLQQIGSDVTFSHYEYLRGRRQLQPLLKNHQVFCWCFVVTFQLARQMLKKTRRPRAVLVHGDTMTTAVGTMVAYCLRIPVIHVEAGMRSGKIFRPFPEELSRRMVDRLATILFVPGSLYLRNVSSSGRERRVFGRLTRQQVHDTKFNTAIDNVTKSTIEKNDHVPLQIELRSGGITTITNNCNFLLVSLHRTEFFSDVDEVAQVMKLLREHLIFRAVVVIAHDATWSKFENKADKDFGDGLVIINKVNHDVMVRLLNQASSVLTDSGGIQQECEFLGIECAVHRKESETINPPSSTFITGRSVENLNNWLLASRETVKTVVSRTEHSPSQMIADHIKSWLTS